MLIRNRGSADWLSTLWIGFLILSVAAGSVLRFFYLDSNSLWSDELFSTDAASPLTDFSTHLSNSLADPSNPPLYYLLLYWFLNLFGYSDIVARGFSALCGVLGIYIFFLLARRLWQEHIALFSAAALALHNTHFFYSQEVRSYSMLFALTTLYLYFSQKFISAYRPVHIATLGLTVAACFYTHYLAIPVILLHVGIVFFSCSLSPRVKYAMLLSIGLALLLLLPLVVHLSGALGTSRNFWTAPLKPFIFASTIVGVVGGKAIALLWAAIIAYLNTSVMPKDRFVRSVLMLVVGYIVLITAYSMLFVSLFEVRYLIPLLPFILVLLVDMVAKVKIYRGISVLVLLLLSWTTFFAETNAFDRRGHGHDPRGLLMWLERNRTEHPIVLASNLEKANELYQVLPDLALTHLDIATLPLNQKFWFTQAHSVDASLSQLRKQLHTADRDFVVISDRVQTREAAYLIEVTKP